MTIIVRDRAQEDKVVKVIEPLNTINLTYDFENNDGRLAFVKNHWDNYNGVEINQTHNLYYGDYLNSLGETENVLQKVQQTTEVGKRILENIHVINTCQDNIGGNTT